MAYILKQFHWEKGKDDNNLFMTLCRGGSATENLACRRQISRDYEVSADEAIYFVDEAIEYSFNPDNTYYVHCKIKRLPTAQVFAIRLVNDHKATDDDYQDQYIKTIEVAPGDTDTENNLRPEWVDVEFIFAPQAAFKYLVFQLARTSMDYREETRYPLIAYQEISIVNSILGYLIDNYDSAKTDLIKIGVQSKPGLLMCIDKQEIRTSRTGIYELQNGVITINFFSVCRMAEETTTEMADWMGDIDNTYAQIRQDLKDGKISVAEMEKLYTDNVICSKSFLHTNKTREIDGFTIDYLYRQVSNNG